MGNAGKVLTAAITAVGTVGGVVGAVEAVETVVEKYEYNNVHEINVYDTYKINGVEVDPTDWNTFLEQAGLSETVEVKETKEIISKSETIKLSFNESDLDIDGLARVAEYVDFDFNKDGKVISGKVYAGDQVKITYEYADDYLSFFQNNKYDNDGLECVLYQDTTKTDGMHFSIGAPTEVGYELITEVNATTGYYIFDLINNPDFAEIQFGQIFKSITLEITQNK